MRLASIKYLLFAALIASLLSCGADSRTGAAGARSDAVYVTLTAGEHRNIDLPIAQNDAPCAVSTVSSLAIFAAGETKEINSSFVRYGVIYAAPAVRPVLRLTGARPGVETVVVQLSGGVYLTVIVTVTGSVNGDLIGGSPIDPDDPGGPDDPDPPGPPDIGDKPVYDPNACVTNGFYVIDDNFQDVEGHFGPDTSAYMRSNIANIAWDSNIRLFYPAVTRPAAVSFVDFGQYSFAALNGAVVNFDLQMAQHLFGLEGKRYFYVYSNGMCVRGQIPTSVFNPPSKSLTWVTSNPAEAG
ncbi:MAG: hypothetical protein LBT81_04180 [Helicobacteraceae bacterium]|jgi:hypothetical protein|nr:hypothetical protein [Helicobacteraceae bacterium]